jgi:hypothetical protein
MRGLLGIAAILLFAWVLSEDRFRVAWRGRLAGQRRRHGVRLYFPNWLEGE